jgi:transcriptional regulator with XRE-family HTH domain
MKNKILEARLKLNLSQSDISKMTGCSQGTISQIELGNYKVPDTITDMWHTLCKAYNMNIKDFLISVDNNYTYRKNNDVVFLQELNNRIRIRKTSNNQIIKTKDPKYEYQKSAAKKLFNKSIELGFYNTADQTEYNNYCKDNNVVISIEEWHIIKKKLESDFLSEHGITQAQYKYVQSLTRCARKVGFGDDYHKYQRWKRYMASHKNEMSLEEWSKYDDEKMTKRKEKSPEAKQRQLELARKRNIVQAEKLGFIDDKQYMRWLRFCYFHKETVLSIEEWKKLDEVKQIRLKTLRNK